MNQSLTREFDYFYRKVYERLKVVELTLPQLSERLEAEEKLTKAFEKISASFPKTGGEFDDLLQGLKVDLSSRANYNKQFRSSFQNDIEQIGQTMKNIMQQIKPMVSEVDKLDKDIKQSKEKYEKQKDSYIKIAKDNEELLIMAQGSEWSKDQNSDNKEKLLQKINNRSYQKQDQEIQYKQAIQQYNQTLNATNSLLQGYIQRLKQLLIEEFQQFKDLALKMLVYEVSRQRNMQYDTDVFFKEVEKYTCSTPLVVAEDYKPQFNFSSLKQNYEPTEFSTYNSFLTKITKQIQMNCKLVQHMKPKVEVAPQSANPLEILVNDPQFIQSYSEIVSDMVRVASNKKPLAESDSQQVDKQQEDIKTEDEKILDPLLVRKEAPKRKKSGNNIQTLIMNFNSYEQEQIYQLIGISKYIILQGIPDSPTQFKELKCDLTQQQFNELMQQRFGKLAIVQTLEQFRIAGCVSLTKVGYKNMLLITEEMLNLSTQDISLMKRLLIMLVTIYKVSDSQKVFLSDGVISNEIWNRQDLWLGLIYTAIEEELQKSGSLKEQTDQTKQKDMVFKDKNIIHQNVLSLTINMISFKLDKALIRSIIQKTSATYNLYEMQEKELYSLVENDGRFDLRSSVTSTNALQSLYTVNETKKEQQNQKRVIMFNPLGNPQPVTSQQQQQQVQTQPPAQAQQFSVPKIEQQPPKTITLNQSQIKTEQLVNQIPTLQVKQEVPQVKETEVQAQVELEKKQTEPPKDKKPVYKSHPLERGKQ